MNRKIPLAWLQLTREKTRFAVALAGIAFADILMFMQLGFKDALFDSAIRFHKGVDADIVLVNPQSNALLSMQSFSQKRLYQALGFKEVQSVAPIYLDFASWKKPGEIIKKSERRSLRNILVIGVNPQKSVLQMPGVKENIKEIKMPDVVLFDRASRKEFGPVAGEFEKGKPIITEVKSRRVKVGGIFTLGASFGADGNIITSDLNFLRLFKERKRGLIDIGVIELKPGVDAEVALERLTRFFCEEVLNPSEEQKKILLERNGRYYKPTDVKVLSKEEFVNSERNYWQSATAIGFIFTLGTIMGFVVGTVIVYQILYSEVADHLPEYATLKAMGYRQKYLLFVVFQEALILATIGYVPGFCFALLQYNGARNATLLPLFMTPDRAVMVLIMTIVMCFISGIIAVRKLQAADPADIF